MKTIKKGKTRFHTYDSVEDCIENYDSKLNVIYKDHYRLNVEIEDIVNKTTKEGNFYFLLLKSNDNQILKGIARVAVAQGFMSDKWETSPKDIVRAKKGDKVTIGGYHYELNDAVNGAEIPIRFLKST